MHRADNTSASRLSLTASNSVSVPVQQEQEPTTRPGIGRFRYKTLKTLTLSPQGHFVVHVPVPRSLVWPGAPPEAVRLTYTAVLGDPDQFCQRGYRLRPVCTAVVT